MRRLALVALVALVGCERAPTYPQADDILEGTWAGRVSGVVYDTLAFSDSMRLVVSLPPTSTVPIVFIKLSRETYPCIVRSVADPVLRFDVSLAQDSLPQDTLHFDGVRSYRSLSGTVSGTVPIAGTWALARDHPRHGLGP